MMKYTGVDLAEILAMKGDTLCDSVMPLHFLEVAISKFVHSRHLRITLKYKGPTDEVNLYQMYSSCKFKNRLNIYIKYM